MRRIEVECADGHRKEIVIGSGDRIPRCSELVYNSTRQEDYLGPVGRCRKKREIVWAGGGPGFRYVGGESRF